MLWGFVEAIKDPHIVLGDESWWVPQMTLSTEQEVRSEFVLDLVVRTMMLRSASPHGACRGMPWLLRTLAIAILRKRLLKLDEYCSGAYSLP